MAHPSAPRRDYLATIGITPTRVSNMERQRAALDRAYELRTFEIGLVWTRATYFFTVQAAIFAAFGFTSRDGAGIAWLIPASLTLLGLATAWFGFLSAKGSRFWQQNWEHHINLLEDELEGHLHKTVVHKGRYAYSVSRSQIWLTFGLAMFWSFSAGATWLSALRTHYPNAMGMSASLAIALALSAALFVALRWSQHVLGSRIRGLERKLGAAGPSRRIGQPPAYILVERFSPARDGRSAD